MQPRWTRQTEGDAVRWLQQVPRGNDDGPGAGQAPVLTERDKSKTRPLDAGLTDPLRCPAHRPWQWQMTPSSSNRASWPGPYVMGVGSHPQDDVHHHCVQPQGWRPGVHQCRFGSVLCPAIPTVYQRQTPIHGWFALSDETGYGRGHQSQHPGRGNCGRRAALPPGLIAALAAYGNDIDAAIVWPRKEEFKGEARDWNDILLPVGRDNYPSACSGDLYGGGGPWHGGRTILIGGSSPEALKNLAQAHWRQLMRGTSAPSMMADGSWCRANIPHSTEHGGKDHSAHSHGLYPSHSLAEYRYKVSSSYNLTYIMG